MAARPDAIHPQLSQGGPLIVAAQIVKGVARLASMMVMARLVAPAHFGLFAMAAVAYGWFQTVRDIGLGAAGLQSTVLEPEQADALFWLLALSGAVCALLFATLAVPLASFYQEPELARLVPALASALLIANLGAVFRLQLLREMKYRPVVVIETGSQIASLIASLTAAFFGFGYWALAIGVIGLEFCAALGFFAACRWRPGGWPRKAQLQALLGFGGAVSCFNVANYTALFLDQFLIGRWFGPQLLGLYGRANQIALLPGSLFLGPLTAWMMHSLSRLRTDATRFRDFFSTIVGGLLLLSAPAGTLLGLDPETWLRWAFGPEWLGAAPMLRPLGTAMIFAPLAFADVWVLLACAASRRLVFWTLIKTTMVAVAITLSRKTGPESIAWALASTSVVLSLLGARIVRAVSPIGPADYARLLWRPILLCSAWCMTALATDLPPGLPRILAGAAFFAASFLGWPALRRQLFALAALARGVPSIPGPS